jgi:hypothetical protein
MQPSCKYVQPFDDIRIHVGLMAQPENIVRQLGAACTGLRFIQLQ